MIRSALAPFLIFSAVTSAAPAGSAEVRDLDAEILVTTTQLPPSPSLDSYAVTRLYGNDLRFAAAPRLDDLLRRVPGFTLFRRASSRVAHPTSQGLSLRGVGPNGAGRTLVLVDGVPANDPFGGWVYWSAMPTLGVESVDIIRGGGAGPWGNAALAGTVRIATRAPVGQGTIADLSYGTKDSIDATAQAWAGAGPVTFDVTLHHAASDGYFVLRAEDRGAVDRPVDNDAVRAAVGATWRGGDNLTARLVFGIHDEERGNGSPLAYNDTRSYDLSLRIVRADADGAGFEATLYGLDRSFASTFVSVAEDRNSEAPALDQYDVPSRTLGGNLLLRRNFGGGVAEFGGDLRYVEGETRERYLLQDGVFRRDRRAGGEQTLGGLFVEYSRPLGDATRVTGGVRLDHLRDRDGGRREVNLDTGDPLLDEAFASRGKTVVNGRLGVTHDMSPGLTARAVAYSGFRQPTINELYRPFRVRNDITEANPALDAERLYGAELGLTWRAGDDMTLDLTGYYTRLKKAIANVLVTDRPGFNGEFGVFVPADGSLNQRRNLERLRTAGLEAGLTWAPVEALSLTTRYLLTAAEVTKALDEPATQGKRPPQVPRHQGSLTVGWTPLDALRTEAVVRGESAQFDDAVNSRRLPGYVTVDLFAGWAVSEHVELYAAAENLFDREIIVGQSGGLYTIGAPRLVRGGIRAQF